MKKKIILIAGGILACALAGAQTTTTASTATAPDKPNASTQGVAQQIANGPVAEYVADSTATLGWSLHETSGNMSIHYGTDRAHLNQTAEGVPGTDGRNYHVRIQGLTPETRYYFQVMMKDEPVGGVGTFRTVAAGTPPLKSKAIIPQ